MNPRRVLVFREWLSPGPWLAALVALFVATAPLTALAQAPASSDDAAGACADDAEPPRLDEKKHKSKASVPGTTSNTKIKLVFTEPVTGLDKDGIKIDGDPSASVTDLVEKDGGATWVVHIDGLEAMSSYRLEVDTSSVVDACGNALTQTVGEGDDARDGPQASIGVDIQTKEGFLRKFAPIAVLLVVVAFVLWRLPRTEIEHSDKFRRRRFFNWFPLGLTYAFLYMGRYNLTVSKSLFAEDGLMTNEDFGNIFAIGAITYGVAFMINGPLCDKFGGRKTMLIGAAGSAVINLLMGLVVIAGYTDNLVLVFGVLYAANMYFQSFGAVSIVKVNAGWFHIRERGVLGGIFGILISLGVYFAYDLNGIIASATAVQWVFLTPAIILALFVGIDYMLVRDRPADAGFENFDLGDATSDEEDSPQLGAFTVLKKMISNPIILTIIVIEFCSGYLRNAIMQWGLIFAKQTGAIEQFVFENWGVMLACAGILAGMFAGVISDYVFDSRRGPVAAILYLGMLVGALVVFFVLGTPLLGWTVVFMSLCIIGVHGMLSGTASMDFGGRKNAGVAVGIIDAAVYLGTGLQSVLLGQILPDGDAARDIDNWTIWPIAMVPLAVLGFVMALRIWNATPKKKVATANS